jgi:glutathione S-transferase
MMSLVLYYGSGSPYGWRAWLAVEHKGVPYELKTLSFDAGDLRTPHFTALNPRQKVPVLVDDGFALSESAVILEYLEDRFPQRPRLFSGDLRERARQRRLAREADAYVAPPMEEFAETVLFTPREEQSSERIAAACAGLAAEFARWESAIDGDHLCGGLSAADFTLYPLVALVARIAARNPDVVTGDLLGPGLTRWARHMETLPIVQKTRPPHWR